VTIEKDSLPKLLAFIGMIYEVLNIAPTTLGSNQHIKNLTTMQKERNKQ